MASLHKLYSLAAILHLDPMEISSWYDAPFRQTFHDGAPFPPPGTHLASSPLPAIFCQSLEHPENIAQVPTGAAAGHGRAHAPG